MVDFSRIQLAAALIEYDNAQSDTGKLRSAKDSALFLQFQRNGNLNRFDLYESSTNEGKYLGTSPNPLERDYDHSRRSRGSESINALRNPFGTEAVEDEEELENDGMEVDLASWGLDSWLPKDKGSRKSKGKGKIKTDTLPNPHPTLPQKESIVSNEHMPSHVADLDDSGLRDSSLYESKALPMSDEDQDTIPFPSSPDPRRQNEHAYVSAPHQPNSNEILTRDTNSTEENNSFTSELPPLPRFDLRRQEHVRSISNTTGVAQSLRQATEDRLESIPHNRQSVVTLGATTDQEDEQMSIDQDQQTGYSRLSLLRPKVLIMPSPLQSFTTSEASVNKRQPPGFELSVDRPLPPSARSVRPSLLRASTSPDANALVRNPRISLSASQLLFRNHLMIEGQRDVSYNDIDGTIGRATVEGEKVMFPDAPEEIEDEYNDTKGNLIDVAPSGQSIPKRPPGKLFGRSLMDDLEARKAELRGKQRVFKGDQRPAMMDRGQRTTSTLINPLSLQQRPVSHHMDSFKSETGLSRRISRGAKPLLNFDGEIPGVSPPSMPRMTGTKSVFGVDTIWERELAKLKEIEAEEKIHLETLRAQEEADEAERTRKKQKKKRNKGSTNANETSQGILEHGVQSSGAPVLPDISITATQARTMHQSINDETDESSSSEVGRLRRSGDNNSMKGWISEEDEPLATTPSMVPLAAGKNEDSDDDIPLSTTLQRAIKNMSVVTNETALANDSEDEDKPLAALVSKPNHVATIPTTTAVASHDDQDDDEPLGVRISRSIPEAQTTLADDDDRPLGLHPDQQRRTQYHILAQQAMYGAQLRSTIVFGGPTPMIGPTFTPFANVPPVSPYISSMIVPPVAPPQQLQEVNKFGRVDKWRRDVAVEGQE